MGSDGKATEFENIFHLFLRLQDEDGNAQITVTVDQNVRLLCEILILLSYAPVQTEQHIGRPHT